MAAINGVKKSTVVKKQKGKYGGAVIAITAVISILVAILAVALFWKFYYEEVVTDKVITGMQAGQYQSYRAIRDIAPGEYIDGAIELVVVPSDLVVANALGSGSNTSILRASGSISANSIITTQNTYDPEMQDPILDTSRIVQIDYLDTPGVEVGEYIDIRLQVSKNKDMNTYRDDRVCSKKEILSKSENGHIQLMLSESEILNLNSAVIEAANTEQDGSIYVTKYIEPATQPKAPVTYDGKGVSYTEEELLEAQRKLRGEDVEGTQPTDTDINTDTISEPDTSPNMIGNMDIDTGATPIDGSDEVNSTQTPNGEGNEGD